MGDDNIVKPLTLNRGSIVIQGGLLKKPWVVKPLDFDGHEFVPLSRSDKFVIKAFGCEVVNIIHYLVHLRNEAVDKLIIDKLVADDPMGDRSLMKIEGPRQIAFAQAEIPERIDIVCKAFTTPDGKRHAPFVATTIASPRRGSMLHLRLDDANLNWLLAAASASEQFEIPEAERNNKREDNDLPNIDQPNVKWRRRSDGAPMLCCSYIDADGVSQNHMKAIPKSTGSTTFEELAMDVAADVQSFYEAHNKKSD